MDRLEVDLVRRPERLGHDDVEAGTLAGLPEGDGSPRKVPSPVSTDSRQLVDPLDRHPTEVEELKDRRARLRHGEGRAHGHGQDGERDHEHSTRDEAPACGDLAGAAEDALLKVGVGRPSRGSIRGPRSASSSSGIRLLPHLLAQAPEGAREPGFDGSAPPAERGRGLLL